MGSRNSHLTPRCLGIEANRYVGDQLAHLVVLLVLWATAAQWPSAEPLHQPLPRGPPLLQGPLPAPLQLRLKLSRYASLGKGKPRHLAALVRHCRRGCTATGAASLGTAALGRWRWRLLQTREPPMRPVDATHNQLLLRISVKSHRYLRATHAITWLVAADTRGIVLLSALPRP